MMKSMKQHIAGAAVAVALALGGNALAFQPASAQKAPPPPSASSKAAKPAPAAAPSDSDIAAARTAGKVWCNTETKKYHTDGQFYGKTKKGKFMTKDEAEKAGCTAAKEPATKKKASK